VPGIIAGAVVGGIVCTAIVAAGIYFGLKRRRDEDIMPRVEPRDYYGTKQPIGTIFQSS
jgi:hypothetical protein